MIKFNEIKIVGDTLQLDIQVSDKLNYQHVYIDEILIDVISNTSDSPFAETFQNIIPSEKAVEVYPLDTDNDIKRIVMDVPLSLLDVIDSTKNLFLIYVKTKGEPDNNCCKIGWSVGVGLNLKPIYTNALNLLKTLGDNCEIPIGLMDYIFKIEAFDLAIKTGNYTLAIDYWKKFFSKDIYKSINHPCGCK